MNEDTLLETPAPDLSEDDDADEVDDAEVDEDDDDEVDDAEVDEDDDLSTAIVS